MGEFHITNKECNHNNLHTKQINNPMSWGKPQELQTKYQLRSQGLQHRSRPLILSPRSPILYNAKDSNHDLTNLDEYGRANFGVQHYPWHCGVLDFLDLGLEALTYVGDLVTLIDILSGVIEVYLRTLGCLFVLCACYYDYILCL